MKRKMMMFVLFVIVLSSFVLAQEETSNNCSGFFGSRGCFIFSREETLAVAGNVKD